jgi:MioC protein
MQPGPAPSGRVASRLVAPYVRREMASILILVGTESGNAQMVADALKPVLEESGHAVDVTDKAATQADLKAHDVLLVVCATHGSGDIPTNILPLAATLERDRPDLSGHRYGVIALGDMTYQDTFCGGGKKVDRVLELCGARKVGDRLEVDASMQPLPDEEALGWIEGWKSLV